MPVITCGATVIDPGVEWLLAIAGAITAITIILKGASWLRRKAKRLEDFFEDYFGTPADPLRGKPEQQGVVARLQQGEETRQELQTSVNETVGLVKQLKDRVEYEMSTNGGGSMRDEVRDVVVEQKRQSKELADIKASADATHVMLSERLAALEAAAVQASVEVSDKLAERVSALENPKEENDNDDPQP